MNSPTNHSSLAETDAAVIRTELHRLLSSRRFSGARQMSAFLRYIVCETLAGNGSRIKAYTVGVDALGKPDDFDAQADPSVRVLALRLRKTLSAAYESSPECAARIVLRVGTYVPEFYKPEAFAEPEAKHVLQSPDHASVDEVATAENRRQDSVDTGNTRNGVAGNNVNRHADSLQQVAVSGGRLESANHSLNDGKSLFNLPKNALAFALSDLALPNVRVQAAVAILLLASCQVILNPVKADTDNQDYSGHMSASDVIHRSDSACLTNHSLD